MIVLGVAKGPPAGGAEGRLAIVEVEGLEEGQAGRARLLAAGLGGGLGFVPGFGFSGLAAWA